MKTLLIILLLANAMCLWAQRFPFPQGKHVSYGHGISPTDSEHELLQTLFDSWKSSFYVESGDLARIESEVSDYTTSESLALGMLFFVYMDNGTNNTQENYNKLVKYYETFRQDNSLMPWEIDGFSESTGYETETKSNLDIALALLMAHQQWGSTETSNYKLLAQQLLDSIATILVDENFLLKPSNIDGFNDFYLTSDFDLAHISLFASVQKEYNIGQYNHWDRVLDSCSLFLSNAQSHSAVGLFPNRTFQSIDAEPDCNLACYFGYEAVKVPWHAFLNYAWFADNESELLLRNMLPYTETLDPDEAMIRVTLDGNDDDGIRTHSAVGSLAFSFMQETEPMQEKLDEWYSYLIRTPAEEDDFYALSYQLLYALCISGNMPNFYGNNTYFHNETSYIDPNNPQNVHCTFSKPIHFDSSMDNSLFSIFINDQPFSNFSISATKATTSKITFTLHDIELQQTDAVRIEYSAYAIWSTDNSLLPFFSIEAVNTLGNNFMLANCENADITTLGTPWHSYNDSEYNGISTVTPLPDNIFTMSPEGADNTENAAKIDYEINYSEEINYGYAGLGFLLAEDMNSVYDLHESEGIAFWHKGCACKIEFLCTYENETIYFDKIIEANNNWEFKYIDYDDLKCSDWQDTTVDFDASNVTIINWTTYNIPDGETGELWIDEVLAIGMESPIYKVALKKVIENATTITDTLQTGEGHLQFSYDLLIVTRERIEKANAIYNNPGATQYMVDTTASYLETMNTLLQESLKYVDFSNLRDAIDATSKFLSEALIGNGHKQYKKEDTSLLANILHEAENIYEVRGTLETEVQDKTKELSEALEATKQKQILLDFSPLLDSITKAQDILANASIGIGHNQYLQENHNEFTEAVSAANEIIDAIGLEEDELQANEEKLSASIEKFLASKIIVDFSELDTIIKKATAILENSHQGAGHNQFPEEAFQPLRDSIAKAEGILSSSATQAEVDTMTKHMQKAIDIFSTKKISMVFTDLRNEISKAQKLAATASIGFGHKQYPLVALTALINAINYALALDGQTGIEQAEIETETTKLKNVVSAFLATEIIVEFTALSNAIDSASTVLAETSEGEGYLQYSVSDRKTLQDSIANAKNLIKDSTLQAQIDSAHSGMLKAIENYYESQNEIVFSSLQDLINISTTLANNADVGNNYNQYPKKAHDEFTLAISKAFRFVDSIGITSLEVKNAKDTLKLAKKTFEASINGVNLSTLKETIAQAQELLITSQKGNGHLQYPLNAITALENNIVIAQNYTNPSATQAEVDTANKYLELSIQTFNESQHIVIFSHLNNKIDESRSIANSASLGAGYNQYSENAYAAYIVTIESANEFVDSIGVTKKQVDSLLVHLAKADSIFLSSKNNIDISALEYAMDSAKNVLGNSNIGNGHKQFPQEKINMLSEIIDQAETIANNPVATQYVIDSILMNLKDSISVFENSQFIVDFSNLQAVIHTSDSTIKAASIGDGHNEYPLENKQEVDSIILYATSLIDSLGITAETIETTILALNTATDTFKASKKEIDFSALIAKINEAEKLADTVTVGTNFGQWPLDTITTFKAMINETATIINKNGTTNDDVAQNISFLNDKIAWFKEAYLKDSNKEVRQQLHNVLDSAIVLLKLVDSNVGNEFGKYSAEAQTNLKNTIDTASIIVDGHNATAQDLIHIKGKLQEAIHTTQVSVIENSLSFLNSSLNDSISICKGDSVVISVPQDNLQFKIVWHKDDQTYDVSRTLKIAESGNYHIEIISENTSYHSDTLHATVYENPEKAVIINEGSSSICTGYSTTLSVDINKNIHVQWLKDNVIIPDSTNNSFVVYEKGAYSAIVQNEHNCSIQTEEVTVEEVQLLAPNIKGNEITDADCIKKDSYLYISNYNNAYSYTWFLNDEKLDFSTDTIKRIISNATYSVSVSNGSCSKSSSFDIPEYKDQTQPVIEYAGQDYFYLFADLKDASNYYWYYNGQLIADENEDSYNAGYNKGIYQLAIEDVNGCIAYSQPQTIPPGYDPTVIENSTESEELSVFPTNAKENISISLCTNYNGKIEIELYTLSGLKIFALHDQKDTKCYNRTIPIRSLLKGLYIAKIKTKENSYARKVVKR